MDYFGKKNTEKFDAIVFGMPHHISDEVSKVYFLQEMGHIHTTFWDKALTISYF